MNKSGELLNRYVVQARMSEVATGLSLVAALVGFWPAWALVPVYGVISAYYEATASHQRRIISSSFISPKSVKIRRHENR